MKSTIKSVWYTMILWTIVWLLYFCATMISANPVYASTWSCPWCAQSANTEVSVRLYNSYSGSLTFNSGTSNWMISWWAVWIGQPLALIDIAATASSSYLLTWWASTNTGQWSWVYINPTFIDLGWEGVHTLQAEFNRSWEFLYSNTLTLYTDYTAPSQPTPTSLPDNTLLTQSTWTLSRWPSVDTWVWLAWYFVYISLNPSFSGIIPIRVTGTSRSFSSQDLPAATIFYKITAIDYLGHESSGSIHYFHNQTSTLVSNGGWQVYQPILPPTPTITTSQIITHYTTSSYLQKRKILTIDTKSLKPYLINHFIADPVDNRHLPDTLPDTGVDRLEPLTQAMILHTLSGSTWRSSWWSIRWIVAILVASRILYQVIIKKPLLKQDIR